MVRESEQQYWMYVTPLCMTEESDDSDTDKIITHKLLWRSDCEWHDSDIGVCVCTYIAAYHSLMHAQTFCIPFRQRLPKCYILIFACTV